MPPAAKPYCAKRVQEHIRLRIVAEDHGHVSRCWIWQSGINGAGYGTGRPSGCRHGLMHRISYEAFVGPIPEGLLVDHLCCVRACCNPDHLEPVTPRENNLRARLGGSKPGSRRTHCSRGHEFTSENTMTHNGARRCRACNRLWLKSHPRKVDCTVAERCRRYRERKKAARANNLVGGAEQLGSGDRYGKQAMSLTHDKGEK